jgi:hypothetical protein
VEIIAVGTLFRKTVASVQNTFHSALTVITRLSDSSSSFNVSSSFRSSDSLKNFRNYMREGFCGKRERRDKCGTVDG